MKGIESIVIVNHGKGFSACLRFKNPRKDAFVSANSRDGIYNAIEWHLRKVREYVQR